MIDIKLNQKPISISIRYNGYYKVVLLLSIIKHCGYGKKASLELLHIVFWSLRNDNNYQVLLDISNQVRKNLIPWTFEHGIDEVLALGLINGYIERALVGQTLEIKITEKGIKIQFMGALEGTLRPGFMHKNTHYDTENKRWLFLQGTGQAYPWLP